MQDLSYAVLLGSILTKAWPYNTYLRSYRISLLSPIAYAGRSTNAFTHSKPTAANMLCSA